MNLGSNGFEFRVSTESSSKQFVIVHTICVRSNTNWEIMADIVVDDALNYLTDESLSRKWTWFLNLDLSLDVTMIFQKKYQGWKLHVVFGGGTRDKMSILRRKEISLLRLENPALTTFVVKKYWLKKNVLSLWLMLWVKI